MRNLHTINYIIQGPHKKFGCSPQQVRINKSLFFFFSLLTLFASGASIIFNIFKKDMISHKILSIVITIHVADILHSLINNIIN